MHWVTISSHVKDVISSDTNTPKPEIRHRHNLLEKYGYDDAGKRGLASKLRTKFTSEGSPIPGWLSPDETQKAKTVGDLVTIIRKKFGV